MTTSSQRKRQIEECNKLIKQKEDIEKQIQDHESVLRSHGVDMRTPLVDNEGFPIANLDIYSIRNARAALVRLYNDLKLKMNDIQEALVLVHQTNHEVTSDTDRQPDTLIPFAIVNGVAPDSPANVAGLKRGDLVLEFGPITSTTPSPLQSIASEVENNEHRSMKLKVRREEQILMLAVIPKPWAGRGLLGCHLVPMFFGYENEAATEDVKGEEENKEDQPPISSLNWGVSWSGLLDSVKKTTEVVTKDLSSLAEVSQEFAKGLIQEDIPKTEEQKANQSAFENALDSLDDGLEKAEKLALTGLTNLGTGLLNAGTSLFASSSNVQPSSKQQTLSDRFAQQVLAAAIDQKTYVDPISQGDSQAIERYQAFINSFDQISHAGKIALLIDEQPSILPLMKKLVPQQLTEEEFWARYYFKVSELELDQKTRSLIVASNAPLVSENDEVIWSDSEASEQENAPKNEAEEQIITEIAETKEEINHDEESLMNVVENNGTDTETPVAMHTSESNSSFDVVAPPSVAEEKGEEKGEEEKKEEDWDGWD